MTKSFGAVRALIDVSVTFAAGAISIIEGPNGSGKSTLLGVLGTLIRTSTGNVDYGDLGQTPAQVRRSLGWVGHDTLCYPDLTGRENVQLAARLAGLDPSAVWDDVAERFAIRELSSRPMRVASRGQRQRVALARALLHKPMLLLLDEPSTGLDEKSVQRVRDVLTSEQARGATVVVVTHDRPFSSQLNGERFQMDKGRLRSASA